MFQEMMAGLLGTKQQLEVGRVLRRVGRAPVSGSKWGRWLKPILCASAAFVALPALCAGLNDTGITNCGADTSTSVANCAAVSGDSGTFPRQDARYGRDAQAGILQLTPIGGASSGKGFDFSKIDSAGNVLNLAAGIWACTRDNVTGLTWEVKTTSGLHDQSSTYSWFQTIQGIKWGVENGGSCSSPGHCDTEKFVADVNAAGLCGQGQSNWRMPTVKELQGIVDFGRYDPAIDTGYFPTPASNGNPYWWTSILDYAVPDQSAWFVDITNGAVTRRPLNLGLNVRLVRGGL